MAERLPSSDWTIMLGVEGRVLPSYEGSGGSVLRPLPIFGVRRAGTAEKFRSPRDGASIGILDIGRFTLGPTLKLRMRRKESDSSDLRGLGDVDWTVEAGAFAEYWPAEWLRTRAELRQGIGGHHGLVSDLMADVVVPVAPKLTLSGGPRLTLATASAESPYFSITAAQAASSGLPAYDAGGGVHSYGAGAQARYAWTPRWSGHMFIEYERLADDAANSPLVTQRGSRDQIQVGIGTTYSFDIHGLW
jgi:outer membrane protein